MFGLKLFQQWAILLAAAVPLFALPADAASTRAPTMQESAKPTTRYRGDVYLLRGFADVFSRGLDQLGADLAKAGIHVKAVSHRDWKSVAGTIAANQKRFGTRPVVLVGHSLGANNAIRVAQELKKSGIAVTYLATLAATAPPRVPSNVRKVTNYYFSSGGWGKIVRASPDFRGVIENLDYAGKAEIGHFNLDEQVAIQRSLLRAVRASFKR